MNRRKFTQSIASAVCFSGLSTTLAATNLSVSKTEQFLKDNKKLITSEGLKLRLNNHQYATQNKDEKQFIITYDVENKKVSKEKIYDVKSDNGETQQIFMSVINENQLQAVFNWRLNA